MRSRRRISHLLAEPLTTMGTICCQASSTVSSTLPSAIRCPPLRRYVRVLGEEDKGMDRCNELCTKDITDYCALCEALAERDRFERVWFQKEVFLRGFQVLRQWLY